MAEKHVLLIVNHSTHLLFRQLFLLFTSSFVPSFVSSKLSPLISALSHRRTVAPPTEFFTSLHITIQRLIQ
ncbi:hypothetical protein AOQ84DRAFT_388652 [Glonium stellatum]|uniref:Uncharacterized protein n=1 Tax=Glonium stellatum TaxID=574774 RepID=A0A8E2F1F7_9PEZI|nr:hypothetical protein AOQ84DRAFT_388652 [Glonium stellatum]